MKTYSQYEIQEISDIINKLPLCHKKVCYRIIYAMNEGNVHERKNKKNVKLLLSGLNPDTYPMLDYYTTLIYDGDCDDTLDPDFTDNSSDMYHNFKKEFTDRDCKYTKEEIKILTHKMYDEKRENYNDE